MFMFFLQFVTPCGAKNKHVMDQIHDTSSQTNLEGRMNEKTEMKLCFLPVQLIEFKEEGLLYWIKTYLELS